MTPSQTEKAKVKLGEINIDIFELIKDIKAYELHVQDRVIVDELQKALDIVEKVERSIAAREGE